MNFDTKEIQTMRNMALMRAIGELEAALNACYNEQYFKELLKPNLEKAIELIRECN